MEKQIEIPVFILEKIGKLTLEKWFEEEKTNQLEQELAKLSVKEEKKEDAV